MVSFNTQQWPRVWMHPSAWLTGGVALLSALAIAPEAALAQFTEFPDVTNLQFQTSGRERGPNIGDWYNSQTTSSTNRQHRFFLTVTEADLAAAGGTVQINILDAESNGALDEVDGNPVGTAGTPDPTQFQLLRRAGAAIEPPTLLQTLTVASGSPDGTTLTFVGVTEPGLYEIRSVTGAFPISGDATAALNDDDNTFRIRVNFPNALLGALQGTFQQSAPTDNPQNIRLFFLVGPGTQTVNLRNFDLDSNGGPQQPTVTYTSPSGAVQPGTPSGDGLWNVSNSLNPTAGTGDNVPVNSAFGTWGITVNDLGRPFGLLGFFNQTLLEVRLVPAPDRTAPDEPSVPISTSPPRGAGNFTLDPSPNPPRRDGTAICIPFVVTNIFFTTDIINLDLPQAEPNVTIEFRDAAGNTVLADTDGDGRVDTGVLFSGESREILLCITPGPDAPPTYTPEVRGTSSLDRLVRQQAEALGVPPAPPREDRITLNLPQTSSGNAGLRLVKRITAVTRNSASLPGVNFNTVVDDPNTAEDNAPGWSQIPLVGIPALTTANPVQSGDEVEYTIYYLADGTAPSVNVNLCDLVPNGTTFIPNTIRVQQATASPTPGGQFFAPLAPLPENNACSTPNNPNGAVTLNLGTVANTAGSNFGLLRFRVRVN